ncbi:hypothetical protein [Tabrizicola flagellatus]|uniref:hypothetical protein n=1 Tax=Tabrizicola flagellatus TaxID=2593021 RepID=UPI0011F22A27|nr:hypothetical protein [Tabrizicola flagellatus]
MRDFFILALEKLIAVIVVLMMIAVLIFAVMAMGSPKGGFLQGLMILVMGGLYVILMGGLLYLFLGIYHNTKRTAELLAARA